MGVELDRDYEARVYAGVLGKLIGVYLGRPVEGWPYPDIAERFGLVERYVNEELGLPLIVADDDISGTFAFGRAMEDAGGAEPSAADVGDGWLNAIVEDRTILWWGGYGRSTEHTAYLNLVRGLRAPESGSIARNGRTLAEQIGAQIFSDAFAMAAPGDPGLAVRMTRAAASVSHDGVALDCAAFFAAMRAAAFEMRELDELVELGRGHVADPRLLGVIDDVLEHVRPGDDWRAARDWVDRVHGYAVHPGPCHSLANTAMSLAALRLGGDDFRRVVAIASSVGFDTDSNAGTVGCLTGIRLGLAAFDGAADLRAPVADRALVVSADGGECVTDAARETRRIADAARALQTGPGAPAPARRPRFDFELPGAVHGFESCPYLGAGTRVRHVAAAEGAIRVGAEAGATAVASTPVFLDPRDAIGNFSTLASPTLYPGHLVTARVGAREPGEGGRPHDGSATLVRLGVLFADGDDAVHAEHGPWQRLEPGATELSWRVPAHGNAMPFRLLVSARRDDGAAPELLVREVDWAGAPEGFAQSGLLLSSIWDTKPAGLAPWVSSAKNFEADFASTFSVSHPGAFGVVTTGTREWRDYAIESTLRFSLHDAAGLVLRARGHRRFTAVVFTGGLLRAIEQHDGERSVLAEHPFAVETDRPYLVRAECAGDRLRVEVDGVAVLDTRTTRTAGGGAGFLIETGTMSADGFRVGELSG
ncbi:ADP-ribosylglycohydrolase family protein [Agromyces soli]|uniref:ADP-ribosylglycohydrolase family protein n=1 Tax=Agromyces soli TaxID=659012 RepID=A0ABY4AU90_9MICO|nr:ADP-ribosylglycohydrolase family protein [Agromyces soli]UOE26708.1 ADP-ribosylglycohydrolase family protein [Agromyces soli]